MKRIISTAILFTFLFTIQSATAFAQTTDFTYQGSLNNGAVPATGNYDFEFALFTAAAAGSQLGSTVTVSNVAVANGAFSAKIDFGNQFTGAARFLEIRVRQTGGGAFTTLAPRQSVSSAPYSVKSLSADNSLQLGGVAANQYVTTSTGGTSFIKNQQAMIQAGSDFWISGKGSANILDATTEFQFRGTAFLSAPGTNIYAGVGAGSANTGDSNSFFGSGAGSASTASHANSLFGNAAGASTTIGNNNAFFGRGAGSSNTTGSNNTMVGNSANVGATDLTNATAIGANAVVSQSNSLVLGNNANVGIGTSAPTGRLHVVGNGLFTGNVGIGTTTPNHVLTVGPTETPVITNARLGVYGAGATYSIVRDTTNDVEGLFGAEISGVLYGSMTNHRVALRTNNVDRITIAPTGEVAIITPGAAGTTALCRNNSNEISLCSSSLRYKTNIEQFSPGLSFINKLRPISFDWKDGGMKDIGFGAEDVAKIDPRFVTYNGQGEIEGVKYDRVGVVLVNAVNEQQVQIEAQQKTIEAQQKQIDELKMIVCQINPAASACQKWGR